VRYRINLLQERGFIQNFLVVIDGGKLGFYYYKVFLRLCNIGEAQLNKLIADLASRPNVDWIIRVDGNFDVGFTVNVTNPVEMSLLMDELRAKYSTRLLRYMLSINIDMHFFLRDYITKSPRKTARLGSYSAHTAPYHLDAKGLSILRALAAAPRASAEEIARQTGASADTVLQRIGRLEKDAVIVRYTMVIDNARLGQVNYYVLIHLSRLAKGRRLAFEQFCQAQPNIVYLIKSLGEWDYEISVETETVQAFRELMMRMTSEFSDIIRDYQAMMVSRIHKYVYP
jgi:DNA-binding Lrp family transcriptional regulator